MQTNLMLNLSVWYFVCNYRKKSVEVGPYGPSTETVRRSIWSEEESIW